jgi:hypothetical protein
MQKRQRSQCPQDASECDDVSIEGDLIDCIHAIGESQADWNLRKLKYKGDVLCATHGCDLER